MDKPKEGESHEHYVNRVIDTYYTDCAIPHDALVTYEETPAEAGHLFGLSTH